MAEARDYREGLILLHRLPTQAARRATFRTSLASLAHAASERTLVPLEGLDPNALLASVRTAYEESLIDDLDWLSRPSAAVALYEIANALPVGPERRDLGRRVVRHLHEGNAATAVAITTSLAFGSRRGVFGAGIRSRVALALELPGGEVPGAEALSLALLSRGDLVREWLHGPARGNLPERRLAAMLLERAALSAARRAVSGDPSALRVFVAAEVVDAMERLLADRAPRVHRPVARARGVLSHVIAEHATDCERDLSPEADARALRRGAASLAASLAIDSTRTSAVLDLLRGPLCQRDPAIFAEVAVALRRAAESEPDACRAILCEVARRGDLRAFDALAELHLELESDVTAPALAIAHARVLERLDRATHDAGEIAWLEALERDLSPRAERGELVVRERVRAALGTFARVGAAAAHQEATQLVEHVLARLHELETIDDGDREGRRRAFHVLRDLDLGLLEQGVFHHLLAMSPRADDDEQTAPVVSGWLDRLGDWLAAREFEAQDEARAPDPVLRRLQLGALAHLADLDEPSDASAARRLGTFRMLLARADSERAFRPAVLEALARACDAIVRDGSDVCDVLVAVAMQLDDESEVREVGGASVVSELKNALLVYADLLRAARGAASSISGTHAFVDVLLARTREMPSASSPRLEAFRSSLEHFGGAVSALMAVQTTTELAEATISPLAQLASATQAIAQLVAGARRRRGERLEREIPASFEHVTALDTALVGSGDRKQALQATLERCLVAIESELPRALAIVARFALRHAAALPSTLASTDERPSLGSMRLSAATSLARDSLPSWIPSRRTLGGFYVLHPLGVGGAASVFVAKRLEERFDDRAERFALKVPAYTGAVARTLSEAAFLQLFREEAGALLALPEHENLARFVTFDSGVKPKPILVMEYVEGPTLARVLERRRLGTARALGLLDGIAAGLEAMHGAGIGHLDLKPSNVILRRDAAGVDQPVLVDFGLAGRHVRPGCATLEYGAPEVWGLIEGESNASPAAVDVYAFAALAFELLTGETLFTAPDENALIVSHALHDGEPPGVARLKKTRALSPLADVLASALRRNPAGRVTITELRAALARVGATLSQRPWPLR